MPTIAELRDRESRRLESATAQVNEALKQLADAEKLLNQRRDDMSRVEKDVSERLNALTLTEMMLAEVKQEMETTPLKGLMQEDAMRAALLKANRVLHSGDLADAMIEGGYAFTSGNPPNSVVVAANKNSRGYFVIEKEGNRSMIGLAEWHTRPAGYENEDTEAA